MKKSTSFRASGVRFTLTAETRPAQLLSSGQTIDLKPIPADAEELTISGTAPGHGGQIIDSVREAGADNPDVTRLCDIWQRWHLNGLKPGTRAQMAHLETVPAARSYDERKAALAEAGLDVDRFTDPAGPYGFGSAWLFDPLPAGLVPELCAIFERLNGATIGEAPDVDDAPEASGDVIDSRDVIARLEAYRGALLARGVPESVLDSATDADFDPEEWALSVGETVTTEEHAERCSAIEDLFSEFLALRELDEAAPGDEWESGATMIRDTYFEEYARQFAEDIGAVSSDASWPNNHIDWDAAADALKADYTEVYFRGETYYVR